MTLAAIVFGVAGLVLSGGFVRDIFFQLGEALIHSQSGHLQVLAHRLFQPGLPVPRQVPDRRPRAPAQASWPRCPRSTTCSPGCILRAAQQRPHRLVDRRRGRRAREGGEARQLHAHRRRPPAGGARRVRCRRGSGVAKALKLAPGDRVTLVLNTAEGALNSARPRGRRRFRELLQGLRRPRRADPGRCSAGAAGDRRRQRAGAVAQADRGHRRRSAAALAGMLDAKQLEFRTWVSSTTSTRRPSRSTTAVRLPAGDRPGDGAAERREQRQHERVRAHRRVRHHAVTGQPQSAGHRAGPDRRRVPRMHRCGVGRRARRDPGIGDFGRSASRCRRRPTRTSATPPPSGSFRRCWRWRSSSA